ncbi:asparagine synthase (glutamine-hydrolyzing) [Priestia filamentosa]|uniref:asparagine synthase (glutamine-hydrolyzing) n=1 Tax=Priestia filamentosa TaxID=1402861 RepID=UPI0002F3513A|nr:asparagine synthase (glutamine-hydrolyzing) [Priestia filamentosa]
MCGFVGHIKKNADFENIKEDVFKGMVEKIFHRGPDDVGIYEDQHVQLGFRRLSILDVEKAGQPLSYDNNRYQLIFNGEIYNYIELRQELLAKGYTFKTDGDSEVLLALYCEEGRKMVSKLRGMFAFLIWDTKTKTVFGARDPFGIKPLYVAQTENEIFLASETKSIKEVVPGDHDLSAQALQHYLSFQYVPEPYTLWDAVKKVEPGYCFYQDLESDKELKFERYFKPTLHPIQKEENEWIKEIQHVLEDSVNIHMRSDVPVGSFLSGGIDSSFVVSLAKRYHNNLKTFSVGFQTDGYSELDVAGETAQALGVENIQKVITAEEFMEELPKIVWHLDDPLADPAAIPLYFVAKEAAKQVTVVLSGEGADELFGGYNIYCEPDSLKMFQNIPSPLKKALGKMSNMLPDGVKGKSFLQRGTIPLEDRYIGNAKMFEEEEKERFYHLQHKGVHYTDITAPFYAQAAEYDPVGTMQYVDMNTWLRGDILLKADKMTMANSLELRVPFLDRRVFEVASRIPKNMKIKDGTTKYILRKAARGIVPDHVLDRRKLGFPVPIRVWLKDELYDWAFKLITESDVDHLFDKKELTALLSQHAANKGDYSRKLWTILMFLMWYNQHTGASEYNPKTKDLIIH